MALALDSCLRFEAPSECFKSAVFVYNRIETPSILPGAKRLLLDTVVGITVGVKFLDDLLGELLILSHDTRSVLEELLGALEAVIVPFAGR